MTTNASAVTTRWPVEEMAGRQSERSRPKNVGTERHITTRNGRPGRLERRGSPAMHLANDLAIKRRAIARHTLLAVAALTCISGARMSQAMDVLCLGVGRGYDDGSLFQIVMMGDSMETVRTALKADGFTFVPSESFTQDVLAGYDLVFLGLFDPAESLAPHERDALETFVRRGGALIYLGDNDIFELPNQSVAELYEVSYGADALASSAKDVADPRHSVIDGAAGRVYEYDGSGNLSGFFGGINDLGPYAHAILNTDNRTLVAVIERDALEPGSGPVVLLADANGFLDPGIGTVGLADNITLMRNIFRFAAGECKDDEDCDDGSFCTGAERCENGLCIPGSFPCEWGKGCHESSDTCGPCVADANCDDGLFCDGVEACGVGGVCQAGEDPCEDFCEQCDEDSDSCHWCMLDLDRNGVIGTGDFGFLSACMGACYPRDDPCVAANFDGDLGACVGSGDFAGFSGCFGLACSECEDCFGPSSSSKAAGWLLRRTTASVRLIATRTPTAVDYADQLPAGRTSFRTGQSFFIELWVSREGPLPKGFAAAYVDLTYDSTTLAVEQITPSPPFAALHKSVLQEDHGLIRSVGGCVTPGDQTVGVGTAWVRVATLQMSVLRPGVASVTSGPSATPLGISVVGEFGTLDASQVEFEDLEVTLLGHTDSTGQVHDTTSPVSKPPE